MPRRRALTEAQLDDGEAVAGEPKVHFSLRRLVAAGFGSEWPGRAALPAPSGEEQMRVGPGQIHQGAELERLGVRSFER